MNANRPELEMSETVLELPLACSNELAAVEFLEKQRWGDTPCCVHCGSVEVYKMMDLSMTQRNKRFLWRCRDCKRQYTVRVGTVYEESRIPLRHWCYAFWRASTSKKGVAALEIMRQTGLSYKSALFLMHRIRYAMSPTPDAPPLSGIVEADETYVGPRKPRYPIGKANTPRGTPKQPVVAMVQRGGQVRTRVVADVTAATLKSAIRDHVDRSATIITDEWKSYIGLGKEFAGGHRTISHRQKVYALPDGTHTNTIEGFFSSLKRGIIGIYHNVSRVHLHRYMSEFEFRYNTRRMDDGTRTVLAIQQAEGRRLMSRYKVPLPPKQNAA